LKTFFSWFYKCHAYGVGSEQSFLSPNEKTRMTEAQLDKPVSRFRISTAMNIAVPLRFKLGGFPSRRRCGAKVDGLPALPFRLRQTSARDNRWLNF
jgi:hypothetical protein